MHNENPQHQLFLAKNEQNTIILAQNLLKSLICIKLKKSGYLLSKNAEVLNGNKVQNLDKSFIYKTLNYKNQYIFGILWSLIGCV